MRAHESAIDAIGDAEERASSAYGDGDFEGSVAAWEDLYGQLLRSGNAAGAARAAAMVAMLVLIDSGLMAPVRGWLRRAEQVLDPHEETPLHALIAALRGYERFFCGDAEAARQFATRAIELGERYAVPEPVIIGQTALGRLTITAGDVAEGLASLDEVGARLMAREAWSRAPSSCTAGPESVCARTSCSSRASR